MADGLVDDLRRLADRSEILDCLTLLARGMDRHDAELMTSTYHPDALDDHGRFRGAAADFIEYVNGVEGIGGVHATYSVHQHYLLNHFVDLDGDEAHSETYYIFAGEVVESGRLILMGGRYLDRLTRRGGRWGITVRRVVAEWVTDAPSGVGLPPGRMLGFTRGTWDRTDPSYQRPLTMSGPARHPVAEGQAAG